MEDMARWTQGGTAVWRVGLVVALAAAITACGDDDSDDAAGGSDPSSGNETTDADAAATDDAAEAVIPGDDWQIDEPEDHDIDPAGLEAAREYAFADEMHTQGVVVVHEGAIVAEWYGDDADADSYAASWSMAKSFTSALVGIAIEDGLIEGVDEPMTTWFPEWEADERADITLRDVLQMSSGLDWVEDYDPTSAATSDIVQMVLGQPDELAYASSRPPLHPAGEVWNYSSGETMLMSGVLEQATGMPADEYAEQELFGPLGMDQVEWWRDAEDHTLTYCCLDTPTRDFARFGLLYSRNGNWGGDQLVPEGWVADSLEPAADSDGGYGYQWWLGGQEGIPDDSFAAIGHDGQYIYVVPSLDLVVARNGTYVKDPGEPVADPNLFDKYPSDALVPGKGTTPPEGEWNDSDFLGPIVEAVSAD
jgi:CubicO group peptidase (beta-lactamase class C family)